jgi:hypothetical protein
MQTAPKPGKRIHLTDHARARAQERYQVSPAEAEALIVADVAAAFAAGRVSPNKPRWARMTSARRALAGQTYAWDADASHTYVLDIRRQDRGHLRVITCLNAIAA